MAAQLTGWDEKFEKSRTLNLMRSSGTCLKKVFRTELFYNIFLCHHMPILIIPPTDMLRSATSPPFVRTCSHFVSCLQALFTSTIPNYMTNISTIFANILQLSLFVTKNPYHVSQRRFKNRRSL